MDLLNQIPRQRPEQSALRLLNQTPICRPWLLAVDLQLQAEAGTGSGTAIWRPWPPMELWRQWHRSRRGLCRIHRWLTDDGALAISRLAPVEDTEAAPPIAAH